MNLVTHETRRANLLALLEKSGLNRSEFAKKIGVSRSYLSQILSTGFRFGEKAARSFERRLGVGQGALDYEDDNPLKVVSVWGDLSDLPEDSFAFVPQISLQSGEDGEADDTGDMALPPIAFRADWLKSKNVTNKDSLRTFDVPDESMEPYLEVGDTVLVDTNQKDLDSGEIYVIKYGEELRIRRISARFDGGMILRCDNPKFPEEIIAAHEVGAIEVVGRMLWRGGSLN